MWPVWCSAVIKAGYGIAKQSRQVRIEGAVQQLRFYLGSLSALLTTDEDEVAHPGLLLIYLKQRIRENT